MDRAQRVVEENGVILVVFTLRVSKMTILEEKERKNNFSIFC